MILGRLILPTFSESQGYEDGKTMGVRHSSGTMSHLDSSCERLLNMAANKLPMSAQGCDETDQFRKGNM